VVLPKLPKIDPASPDFAFFNAPKWIKTEKTPGTKLHGP
jgi:hypothetical protein